MHRIEPIAEAFTAAAIVGAPFWAPYAIAALRACMGAL